MGLSRRADARRDLYIAGRGTGLPSLSPHPFPRLEQPASASLRIVSLDEAEHFAHNQKASVATLRWCSPSARNAVRLPSETAVRLRRNPHLGAGVRDLRRIERTQMIRIPGPGHMENRAVDIATNPYLQSASLLVAGLDGIESKIDPGQRTAKISTGCRNGN